MARGFDALQRINSISVNSASSVLNQIGYSYDAASRLDTVTQSAHSASYAYAANSPLVQSVTFRNGVNTRLLTSKSYDNLNRLTSIANTNSASFARSTAYEHNAANQRIRATRENGAYWQYGYDSLGQVTSAKKFLSTAQPIQGFDHAWTFDDIGNRKTSTINGQTASYSTNALNQYSQRRGSKRR